MKEGVSRKRLAEREGSREEGGGGGYSVVKGSTMSHVEFKKCLCQL